MDNKFNVPLTTLNVPADVLAMVPQNLMENYVILPIAYSETGILTLVTSKHQNVLENLNLLTNLIKKDNPNLVGLDVREVTYDNFQNGYFALFHKEFSVNISDEHTETEINGPTSEQTKLAEEILDSAIKLKASDIHIIPKYNGGTIVKFRINGKLFNQQFTLSTNDEIMLNNIYQRKAGIEVSNLMPRDGHFPYKGYEVRFNSEPYGDKGTRSKIAMRINSNDEKILSLEELAFNQKEVKILEKLAMKPNGIFLVCGPTSEGKSTTLYSIINLIKNQKNRIILTFEDPIEKYIEGITQCQVRYADNEKNSFTFAKGLRAALRQDPDVIQVGEIRDTETALVSVQASQTGHLILSTLHVRNSISVFRRLEDMGANVSSFTEQIIGIASQRLLAKLCPHCRKRVISPLNDLLRKKDLDLLEEGKYSYEADGCEYCGGTGIIARMPIIEIIEFNNYLRDFFSEHHGLIEIEKFLREKADFQSLWDKGIAYVAKGEISLSELIESIEVDEDLEKGGVT